MLPGLAGKAVLFVVTIIAVRLGVLPGVIGVIRPIVLLLTRMAS